MKFAAPYQLDESLIKHEDIDEFNIKFTEYSSFEELRKFVKMYPEHQINIEFSEEGYNLENIINFCNDFKNIYILLHSWELQYLQFYEENNINYILDKTMPIYSYVLLEWALNRKVKGIYITDDLTYNLEQVSKQCKDNEIQLRIILNRIPMTNSLSFMCPTVQVYRPRDYDFLSQYYDVGEFDCGDKYDWVKAEVLYRKWFIEHDYNDDLDFMNYDLILPYPTKSIPSELIKLRSVCQHRCTLRSGNFCSKCKRLLFIGYKNMDNNTSHKLSSLDDMVDSIIISKNNNNK